jgi:four helix bundle protein
MRRAAVSIPANIAEGYCRRRPKAYLHHVSIAMGSHAELETLLEIAARLRYVEGSAVDALDRRVASIGRLLHALHRSLEHMVAERNEAKRRTRT